VSSKKKSLAFAARLFCAAGRYVSTAHDKVSEVTLDGAFADGESVGDLFVRFSVSYEAPLTIDMRVSCRIENRMILKVEPPIEPLRDRIRARDFQMERAHAVRFTASVALVQN